jgi:glucose-1-phosphate thymidylyltransferase
MSEVIGLIPAAGRAKRISPLPCSKELYPVGFWGLPGAIDGRPKVVCHYLLEKMRFAGITKAYIILREGKWDIPTYLRDGRMLEMYLAYLMVEVPFGPPYTLDQAYPFVRDAVVAFGFPDILFEGDDAFLQLLSYQATSDADILLGLFPGDRPEDMDMVDLEESGRVRELVIKPRHTELRHSWNIAVWRPAFTEFLHQYLAVPRTSPDPASELSIGHILQAAIGSGVRVEGMPVCESRYLDIGTPKGLGEAIKHYTSDWQEKGD